MQMVEMKKKFDNDTANAEAMEELRKKAARDMDALQAQLDETRIQNERLDKSRKKLQAEVG